LNFTEIIFLPFFFLTYTAFALARKRTGAQLSILLLASYLFYAWWRLDFLALILFSSGVDFAMGLAIQATPRPRLKKMFLVLSLTANLGLLGYFKYADFFIAQANRLAAAAGFGPLPALGLILPVGISFYTFQSMSYTIDIYRGQLAPTRSVLKFFLFVAAFPQLVAGPIVRARELLPQLQGNLALRSDPAGMWLILYGLFKKMVLADQLGAFIVDPAFARPAEFSSLELLLATWAYAFQIFLDFSAYSHIAIGLGRLLGLTLPENFRQPYLAANPREFWQRWHITLSTWLRDYLYIPLGGSRGGTLFTLRNLMITMLLGGLWHGAGGNFVIWGGLHGLFLCLHRLWSKKPPLSLHLPRPVRVFLFFQLVCLAWVFFRSPTVGHSFLVLSRLAALDLTGGHLSGLWLLLLGGAAAIHFGLEGVLDKGVAWAARTPALASAGAYLGLFLLLYLLAEHNLTHQAFIYFQF